MTYLFIFYLIGVIVSLFAMPIIIPENDMGDPIKPVTYVIAALTWPIVLVAMLIGSGG